MTFDIKTTHELGEAKILKYIILTSNQTRTGNTRHIIEGKEQTEFYGLAICKYDNDQGTYLFYCDSDWNVLTDNWHETIEDAQDQASFEFENLEGKWITT